MRTRRHHRRARRRSSVLSARARHSEERGREPSHSVILRRGNRTHRERENPRCDDEACGPLARRQRLTLNAPAKVAFDVGQVRADFPILSKEVYGKKLVYLDNAASAQKPVQVLDRMRHAYEHEYANVHRGLHFLANAATEAYEGAREKVRGFLNAKSSSEIVFVKNATEAINLVASSFGLAEIGEGDEIVLSIMEHHSNIVPWHYHRERKGAVIKWAPVDEDGNFLLGEFEKLLTKRTKIVAITQMSNALGTIVPVKEVVRLAHARGIPVLVDGSQGAVHLSPDVQDIDADFYVFTGHKLYGPSGIGVLYAKQEWLERLPPFLGGGEMIREVTETNVTYGEPPHKFEAGTPAIVPAVGLGAAIDYVKSFDPAQIAAHEKMLLDYATEKLSRINSLKFYGRAKEKGAILSFEMKDAHPHDIATVIDRQGVAVRAGTHCALPLLQRYGCTATCRASFALYNTKEEVDALAEALIKAQDLFA
ncbi:MAG: cysteine desulfurase [Xanthobacteraceae bacterium]|nr:cysteine desulfurase [Xanthobacteraceae bacterium]MCW5674460.1 cysteine desulfurase [Xanthobacteraceae bacterium]